MKSEAINQQMINLQYLWPLLLLLVFIKDFLLQTFCKLEIRFNFIVVTVVAFRHLLLHTDNDDDDCILYTSLILNINPLAKFTFATVVIAFDRHKFACNSHFAKCTLHRCVNKASSWKFDTLFKFRTGKSTAKYKWKSVP